MIRTLVLWPGPGPRPRTHERWARGLVHHLRELGHRPLVAGSPADAVAHGRDEPVDVVYATLPPYTTAETALRLGRERGKPWVADLRDPWALDETSVYPTALHRHRDLRRMRNQLATAAAIVTTTPEAARRIRQHLPHLPERPIVAIPSGYDRADFETPPPVRADGRFRIVHTDRLHGDLGALLEALDRLVEADPSLRDTIELHLAGVLSERDLATTTHNLTIHHHGYLPHHETIQLMRSADLLFLPMQNLPPGTRSTTTPGKTYEYLASGRPILAAIPDGDTRDLLLHTDTAHTTTPADPTAIATAIANHLDTWHTHQPTPPPPPHLLARLERRRLIENVAEVLEHVASGSRSQRVFRAERDAARTSPITISATRETSACVPREGTDTRRVLYIAYYLPPIGGSGAQRSLKFARYLPELGYRVRVITGSGASVDRWSPTDDTLAAELPATTEIVRARGPEPERSGLWRSRAERWLGLESPYWRWWTEQIVERGVDCGDDVDVICATASPYETIGAAARLARRLGKPWVADLRDPWALDEMTVYPTALHRHRDLRRMRNQLATAAAIVTTTPEAARRIRQHLPHLPERPIVAIPNGYDRTDFETPPPVRADGRFRIVHTGYLHTELGHNQRGQTILRRLLRPTIRGVDILTRSHVYLLEALDRLVEADPSLRDTIELHLAGVLSERDLATTTHNLTIHHHGYLPHHETIQLMRSADLLFLPMQNLPPGTRSTTTPGKTYEYLASGRPILAAIPDGDTRDLLLHTDTAHTTTPADPTAIATAIASHLDTWHTHQPTPPPPPHLLARLERRALTAELAAILDRAVGTSRSPRREAALEAALAR